MKALIRFCLLAVIISMGSQMNISAQEIKGEAGKWAFQGKMTNSEDTLLMIATDNLKEMNTVVRTDGAFTFSTATTTRRSSYPTR